MKRKIRNIYQHTPSRGNWVNDRDLSQRELPQQGQSAEIGLECLLRIQHPIQFGDTVMTKNFNFINFDQEVRYTSQVTPTRARSNK